MFTARYGLIPYIKQIMLRLEKVKDPDSIAVLSFHPYVLVVCKFAAGKAQCVHTGSTLLRENSFKGDLSTTLTTKQGKMEVLTLLMNRQYRNMQSWYILRCRKAASLDTA